MTPWQLRAHVDAWVIAREDETELAMLQAYHTAELTAPAFHAPKRFPRRFEDFYKRRRQTPTREQSDSEKWAAFMKFAKGA